MLNREKLLIDNVINLTRSSERKFREGNFKGAIEDKRQLKSIMNDCGCAEIVFKKFKAELSKLYSSKFDLINDHKLIIDELKISKIIKLLEQKSEEKFRQGDFKGSIRALRRSEKYLVK